MTADWLTRREPHQDAPGLDDLVEDAGAFVADDLFRRATWSSGAAAGRDPARFATTAALWTDLLGRGTRTPSFRLVQDGATLAPSTYCRTAGVGHRTIDDVVQPNRVLELHQAGATAVLQGLQLSDPHLARAANNLALALDHPVQVNAYLTPPGTKGLELHFDYHDVFVLQLDGSKRWRVWEPLPRTHQPVRRGPAVPMPTFDELGEPVLDLTMEAGDCLYLPRGFPHAAETIEAASSHLTIGVMALTWQQAVHRAVDDSPGPLTASISSADAPSLATVAGALTPLRLQRWMATEVWRRQPATRLRPLVTPDVAIDSKLAVTAGPLLWLATGDDHVQLGLGDRELRFPIEAHELLAALLTVTGPCTLDELDGPLDTESRLVVGRRLAAEGVVAPVG